MVEHGEEGAFGVVLNRLSETTVAEAVPALAELAGPEELVRIGGPVGPESVVVLGEFEDPVESPKLVFGDLGVVDPERGAGPAAGPRLRRALRLEPRAAGERAGA